MATRQIFGRARRAGVGRWGAGLALALALLAVGPARAQDAYFSQPFANRLADNPAWAGLVDDYGATLTYRNQFPQLPGAYLTGQLAADWRLPQRGLHQALGLVVSQDRAGSVGLTRLGVAGQYAYHRRLTRALALSAGAQAGYGRQRLGADNLGFGDQYAPDGTLLGPSADPLALAAPPANYLTLGLGTVLYTEYAWLSLSGQHLNQPDLGFQRPGRLPRRWSVGAGFKLFLQKPEGYGASEAGEISLVPTVAYTRQGGSQRSEAGLYLLANFLTLGATYRNLNQPNLATQHLLVLTTGLAYGDFRLGYSYDVGLTPLAADLGGAHEISVALRAFDRVESLYRRLRRRAYPPAPCPRF